MRIRSLRVGLVSVLGVLAPCVWGADTIVLTNGHVIQADRAWFEGSQLFYEKAGGVFGLPRTLVASVRTASETAPAAQDPAVTRALELSRKGQDREAVALLRATLAREPRNAQALRALSEASLRTGDVRAAADAAQKAVQLDERNPRSHELLGDALQSLGNPKGAAGAYRASLRLAEDQGVQRKLLAVEPRAVQSGAAAKFRLRYDGGMNEPLGLTILEALNTAYAEYSQRLAYAPAEPVTVVLQTEADFQTSGAPIWAEGVNDGTVRIPAKGVERTTPRLQALLRHELAHSFVTSRTGGNSPTWVQEGVAQWLEGGDPARSDAGLASRARSGTLFPLLTLEAPFQNLAASDVPTAYAESLSGIAHLLRLRGEAGLQRLLAALGDGLPSEEALPVAIGMAYGEFQRDWEQYLRTDPRTDPSRGRP